MNKSINTNTELNLANAFIQSKLNLTSMDVKLLFAIAYKIQKGDNGLNIVDFTKDKDDNAIYYTAQEIAQFLGISKNSYKHFYNACDSLAGKNISLKDDFSKHFRILSFLIEAEYKEGILKLVPNPAMKPFYLNLTRNYTRLELMQVLKLKSVYAIRIYTFIKMKAQQNRNAYLFELDEFKELLGIEKQYDRVQNLKVRILEPVKKELNEIILELEFNYELIRIGRYYKQLRFTFNGNALNYTVIQDDKYFQAFEKFRVVCKGGQYCEPDESQECRFCKMKIKRRHE